MAIDKQYPYLRMSQNIKSHFDNGLLLYIGNEFDLAEVLVIIESRRKLITVNIMAQSIPNTEVKTQAEYNAGDFVEYYIGGASSEVRERNNITMPAFKGCLRNVKLNNEFKSLMEVVGVSRGCPKNLALRKAEFNLGSSLTGNLTDFSLAADVSVSLGFKSSEAQGLLLQNSQLVTGIKLELVDGHVVLTFGDTVWKSTKQYKDGQWHYVTVIKTGRKIDLLIDDKYEAPGKRSETYRPGPDTLVALGKDTFKGCVSNVYLRRPSNLYRAEDLSMFTSTGNALVGQCSSERPPHMMLDSSPKKI
ncbi:hypothetical protein CRUP_029786 [Coryphaenoides rupestris]|nr:hypothetical protein CRUP_029786 [Coryphaenoides rupestris]